jgi:hypothetical protein
MSLKSLSEIKEVSNQLARRAKMGQLDEKSLFAIFNDLVNTLAAMPVVDTEDSDTVPTTPSELETPGVPTTPISLSKHIKVVTDVPTSSPKRRGRPRKNPVEQPLESTVDESPSTTAPEPGSQRTIPLNIKLGRGVTIGTKGTIKTGVTVGSAPVNPAGAVTVGGRPRNS